MKLLFATLLSTLLFSSTGNAGGHDQADSFAVALKVPEAAIQRVEALLNSHREFMESWIHWLFKCAIGLYKMFNEMYLFTRSNSVFCQFQFLCFRCFCVPVFDELFCQFAANLVCLYCDI